MKLTEWVSCPICDEPDMRKETDAEGNALIFCVNYACKSNGGSISGTADESSSQPTADDVRSALSRAP